MPALVAAIGITIAVVLLLDWLWDRLWIGLVAAPVVFAATEVGLARRVRRRADSAPSSGLRIVKASLVPVDGSSATDVTDIVRRHVNDGRLAVPVDYRVLGNPSPGIGKWLTIEWSFDGEAQPIASWPEKPEPITAVLPPSDPRVTKGGTGAVTTDPDVLAALRTALQDGRQLLGSTPGPSGSLHALMPQPGVTTEQEIKYWEVAVLIALSAAGGMARANYAAFEYDSSVQASVGMLDGESAMQASLRRKLRALERIIDDLGG
jgi:hypothetical protein